MSESSSRGRAHEEWSVSASSAGLSDQSLPFQIVYNTGVPSGYVVFQIRSVIKCDLLKYASVHAVAAFICEDDAKDYAAYRNDRAFKEGTQNITQNIWPEESCVSRLRVLR